SRTVFRKVLELVKEGKRFEARRLIADELNRHPGNADAWIVMAQLVDDRERAIYYLKRALEINPDEQRARYHLEKLRSKQSWGAELPSIGMASRSNAQPADSDNGHFVEASKEPTINMADTVELIREAIDHSDKGEQPSYKPRISVEAIA